MKENKYDNELFFEKYSEMSRSKEGLTAAGEWETLKALLPEFTNKRVLDLGCGYGWHCIYALENKASSVVGVDISEKMLEVAREKTKFANAEYICSAMEDVNYPDESFDIIISSLALHYVFEYEQCVKNMYRMLKKGGRLVFSAEHPVFTAEGSQNWLLNNDGSIKCFPVDNYYYEGKRTACFLGEDVVKYHRTFTTYVNTLLTNGFKLLNIVEPQPSEQMIKSVPGMADEMRRPMMLIVSAEK